MAYAPVQHASKEKALKSVAFSPVIDYGNRGLVKTTVLLDARIYREIVERFGKKKLSETINERLRLRGEAPSGLLGLAGAYPALKGASYELRDMRMDEDDG